jgi:ribosomal protein S14
MCWTGSVGIRERERERERKRVPSTDREKRERECTTAAATDGFVVRRIGLCRNELRQLTITIKVLTEKKAVL